MKLFCKQYTHIASQIPNVCILENFYIFLLNIPHSDLSKNFNCAIVDPRVIDNRTKVKWREIRLFHKLARSVFGCKT